MGGSPLADQYPSLYNIFNERNVTVAEVVSYEPLNIDFRRSLSGNKWTAWLNLIERIMRVNLTVEPDKFQGSLSSSGVFSVKSMYADYMNDHTVYPCTYVWLKIKVFMWFLSKMVFLTKDNLSR